MRKVIAREGLNFTLSERGVTPELGYLVQFERANKEYGAVQFGIHLTSSMKPVGIPYRLRGSVIQAEFDICKEIVDEEVATRPSISHVVASAQLERDRLLSALRLAAEFTGVSPSDPEHIAVEQRKADLTAFLFAIADWGRASIRDSFEVFLSKYSSGNFETIPQWHNSFPPHPPMGPLELVNRMQELEDKPATIVVVRNKDGFSRMPYGLEEGEDYDWPLPYSFSPCNTKWVHLRWLDLLGGRSEKFKNILNREDTIALVWTRRTDIAAFKQIAFTLGYNGSDPRLIIGSPEGTLIGSAQSINTALASEPKPLLEAPRLVIGGPNGR